MPEITIQQSTFERLQKHAKPFVDTPETVINRALDALEGLTSCAAAEKENIASERQIDPRILPSLTHTKVLDASIEAERILKPNWNLLLERMLVVAMKRLSSFEKLRELCPINMVRGRKEFEGYSYVDEIDISVQGLDANAACRTLVSTAQGLGVALDIGFMWRHKETAAHPGERARLRVPGKQTENGTRAA